MSYNKVILLGNLTKEPELKFLPSQTAVCTFGIATNRKWKDAGGQKKEEVCFVDCVLFGKRGEALNKFFHKGDPIFIEGRLSLDMWDAKDGTKRSKHKISVENFEFIAGKKEGANPDPGHYDNQNPRGNDDTDIPF